MLSLHTHIRRLLYLVLIPIITLASAGQLVYADTLTTTADGLSSAKASDTGVTHSISFTTLTTSNIQRIGLRFSTTDGGTDKPTGLDVSSATLTSTSGLGTGWSLNTASAGVGLIYIGRAAPDNVNSGTNASIVIGAITNPAVADCNASTNILSDTCYITITTYSDDGHTRVDEGTASYTITEDPYFNLDVSAVPSGETHNGITTTLSSTDSSIPFGNLSPGDVQYVSQKLVISTNAPQGYTVYAHLKDSIVGSNIDNQISPFGATDATWETPQAWEDPYGTNANSNTGWLAANTSDTRVSGWFSASNKFGPVSVTKHAVATSTTSQRTPTTIYVTYAFGINAMQPADIYSGKVIYEIQATY